MDGFLKAVPEGGGGSMVDSLLDSLGSTGTTEGGAQDLAGLASLAGSFQSLGLSPSMIPKFVPALERYIGMKGGSGLAGLFGSLFGGALK